MATLSLSVSPALMFLRCVVRPAPGSIALQRFSPFLSTRPSFHSSARHHALLSQKLTDVGEGTTEAQIIQWYVQEGARVEEWGNLCEVQTDKASVDISSRHTGVVKKLHFEADATVKVGQALLDIEVEGDAQDIDLEKEEVKDGPALMESERVEDEDEPTEEWMGLDGGSEDKIDMSFLEKDKAAPPSQLLQPESKHTSLATPAVRGLLREHKIAIEDIRGTGKDGRVLKEDVQNFIAERAAPPVGQAQTTTRPQPSLDVEQTETPQRLTPIQSKMFQTMTASLSIPHFLYSDTVNVTRLAALRKSLNETGTSPKLSFLPFAIKAVSLALYKYPILNAKLDITSNPQKPQLLMRSMHNIGIAMDTPGGLVVPVIKNVGARSIYSIAEEISRFAELGQRGKLSTADFSGGTITISNIGSIGGDVVSPIIVDGQLAIMGMGKVKAVPVFAKDGVAVEKAEMMGVCWSADHRVVDGATMARAAKVVQALLEEPLKMMLEMS